MKKFVIVAGCVTFLFTSIFLTGCGKKSKASSVGKSVIVEKSNRSKPRWTTQIFTEDRNNLYVSGQASGKDYALTTRLAKSEAVKNIVEAIQTKARSEFSSVVKEYVKNGEVSRYIDDSIAMVSENVRVGGMFIKEVYYEKKEISEKDRVDYGYDVWALVKITKKDYQQARDRVIEELENKAKNMNNKDLEEAAQALKERLYAD